MELLQQTSSDAWLEWVTALVPLLSLEVFEVDYHAPKTALTERAELRASIMSKAFTTSQNCSAIAFQ